MRPAQVHDVDIIPDAGAVLGLIVLAVNGQLSLAAAHGAHHVRNKMRRLLHLDPDLGGRMRPGDVEIAQRDVFDASGRGLVPKDLFDHDLGRAIGTRDLQRLVFRDGIPSRLTVHAGR